MSAPCPLIVFSDLDGTLIDHETYDWRPASDALAALKNIGAGLVLASSKTAAEIHVLRAEVGFADWPAIVENGAGLLPAGQADAANDEDYRRLRAALDDLPQDLRVPFFGFGDMGVDGVVKATGLSANAAALACQRCHSEPGLWTGSDALKTEFLAALQAKRIVAQQGGRFLTLSFGKNKVDQMQALRKDYQPLHTIALGDAPNDIAMLNAADFGVIIANPHGPSLPPQPGEATGQIIRTVEAGPSGWNKAIQHLLDQLELN